MVRGEPLQIRAAGRRAVVVEDLADHAGRIEAGEAREVHRGLGVPDALQHATLAGAQRVHVAGPNEVAAHGGRVHRHLDGLGAVRRADAGGHAEAGRGIDAHGERGAHGLGVLVALRREPELVHALRRERQADHALGLQHEVHHLGRHELRRADEIALVLAILVVRDDDELAGLQVRDGLFYGSERHIRMRRPTMRDRARRAGGRTCRRHRPRDACGPPAGGRRVWCAGACGRSRRSARRPVPAAR